MYCSGAGKRHGITGIIDAPLHLINRNVILHPGVFFAGMKELIDLLTLTLQKHPF